MMSVAAARMADLSFVSAFEHKGLRFLRRVGPRAA
jgi:hypothetical protein